MAYSETFSQQLISRRRNQCYRESARFYAAAREPRRDKGVFVFPLDEVPSTLLTSADEVIE